MGDSSDVSAGQHVEKSMVPHRSVPTVVVVAEDDEEPPSSGSQQSVPQLTIAGAVDENSIALVPTTYPHPSAAPAVFRKDFADADVSITAVSSSENGRPSKHVRMRADSNAMDGHTRTHKSARDLEKLDTTPDLPSWRRPFHNRPPFTFGRLRKLFTPTHTLGPRPTYWQSLKAVVTYSPLNFLLVFIPVAWTLGFTHQNPTLIFVFSCLGIIPLAALLGLGTEQIALKTSQSVGGLLNATLGNIIEMIISAIALKQCELEVIQSALLGGLLSNLLLVTGMAFLVGGIRYQQSEFQPMVAQLNSSLMILSVVSLTIPSAFHQYLENRLPQGKELPVLLQLSRGSAIILILIYVGYLVFQFYSHNHLFLDTSAPSSRSSRSSRSSDSVSPRNSLGESRSNTLPIPVAFHHHPGAAASSHSIASATSSVDSVEMLKLNTPAALLLLAFCTSFAYVTADHLVASLEGLVANNPGISKEWVTLIIIPIIGNAAEHTTAVVVAGKGKFDLAMSVAIGSCIQISLFVIPILVLAAWGVGKPLTLLFDPLETIVLFFSVLLVKFSVEDGRSHWMSGMVLIGAYILIALAFWNFPEVTRIIQGAPIPCLRG